MISEALIQAKDNIRENVSTTVSGIVTISFSLIIIGTFILIYLNLIHLTTIVFHKSNYSIFLDEASDEIVRNRILSRIATIWGMGEIREVSSEKARKQLIESFGEAQEMLEKVDFPKFPHIIEFTLSRPDPLSKAEMRTIRSLPGVIDLVSGRETREQIKTFFTIANFVGVFLVVLLMVAIVLIIHNSIQIAIRTRIKEIQILKILGATSGFIKLPYVVEGVLIAVVGYVISLGLVYFLFEFVIAGITFNEATFGIRKFVRFFSWVEMGNILFLLIGLGIISSILATNKILNQLEV
ncbi:MAG: FtsX-like permease family protein [Proteobacteria bacterium]|nr:FtsX-like permease family protein [Pseudomonadota bacterium]